MLEDYVVPVMGCAWFGPSGPMASGHHPQWMCLPAQELDAPSCKRQGSLDWWYFHKPLGFLAYMYSAIAFGMHLQFPATFSFIKYTCQPSSSLTVQEIYSSGITENAPIVQRLYWLAGTRFFPSRRKGSCQQSSL